MDRSAGRQRRHGAHPATGGELGQRPCKNTLKPRNTALRTLPGEPGQTRTNTNIKKQSTMTPGPGSSGQRPSRGSPATASPSDPVLSRGPVWRGCGPAPPSSFLLRERPAKHRAGEGQGCGRPGPLSPGRGAQALGAELHLATAHRVGEAKLGHVNHEVHPQARQCQRHPP